MTELPAYNFAYLDEQTKRMIRRALLKAIAIPGYQVPFASREMPMPYGWGTGGVQVTASILGPDDVLKVIDQGADDTTNAVSIRRFFARTAGVATTTRTTEATIIQTRHRIPETPLREGQILVYQVPIPEPLRFLEPRETETRQMHALEDYGLMHVKLYEDIARHGHIATTYAYPVKVDGRYLMDPSPTPKFDNPKMDMCPALQLFGAGREQRIYALPPYTRVVSLDFDDHPFERTRFHTACALCGTRGRLSRRGRHRRRRRTHVRVLRYRSLREPPRAGSGRPRHDRSRDAAAHSRRPDEALWRARRLHRRVARDLPGRGAGRGRRIGIGQVDPALPAVDPAQTDARQHPLPHARRRRARPASRWARPSAASCCAPTGASCTRTPGSDCAWACRPAATSASG